MSIPFLMMILIPFILLIIILGFITLNRYINYKERVALAQLGFSAQDLDQGARGKGHGNRGVLWGGVITAMSGLALLLGLATLGTGAWLLGGLLPLFVGLGMVLIYFVTLGPIPETRDRSSGAGSSLIGEHGRATGDAAIGQEPFAAICAPVEDDDKAD